jgi:glycosyltransferase involved in cell wall biosynthesis
MCTGEHRGTPAPEVSVIMPVHDMPPKLVRSAIRSVRRQDHHGPIEVVLWDDGSCDPHHRAAYQRMGASFDAAATPAGLRTIVTFRSEERRGIAHSRNAAVLRAGGDWLIWLDGDDELPSDAISRLLTSVRLSGNPYAIGQCRVLYPGGAVQVHRNADYLAAWKKSRGTADDPLSRVVFNTHGGIVRRDLFDRTGGFDPYFSHAELVDWFRRLFRELPDPAAFDVLDAVTYVYRKREDSHSSDRQRVQRQRVTALQRYAREEGMPSAELDAPTVNAATGCPEYKRVQRRATSAGVELFDLVPPCPGSRFGDAGAARALDVDVVEAVAPLRHPGPVAVVVQQVEHPRGEVPQRVGDEIAVDDAGPGLAGGGADVGVVEFGSDDRAHAVEVEREGVQLVLSLVDPPDALVEDPGGLAAHALAVGEDDDEGALHAPVLAQLGR